MNNELQTYEQGDEADLAFARPVVAALNRHYPGHEWNVEVNLAGGVCTIQLPVYAPTIGKYRNYGVTLHIMNLGDRDSMLKVMRWAGELLERHGLRARAATEDSRVLAAVHGLDAS